MRARSKFAIRCAKGVHNLILKMGKGSGATLPGLIARLIDPRILSELAGQIREKTFATMGTNGKTTTNNILYHALEKEGYKVVINKTGANMLNGIISAFVLSTGANGELDADYACIEVDELASKTVLPQIRPDFAVLTNISRDQLDRFGEVDIVFNILKEAVSTVKDTTLIINCDDVLSYTLAKDSGNKYVTYGINEQVFSASSRSEIRESTFCRVCGHKLKYEFYNYGQIGIYSCPHCGLKRPEPQFRAKNIDIREKSFSFEVGGREILANASTSYNLYNVLNAYTALSAAGAGVKKYPEMIRDFDFGNNRESHFQVKGCHVQLHLAKNPIGFQQKIAVVLKDRTPKDIIISINDGYQDGEDVSWLWDVDFQYLGDEKTQSITAVGTRRYDMCLRLKYDDIVCKTADTIKKAVEYRAEHGSGNLYVIVNYTGLYSTRAMLERMEKEGDKR